MEGLLSLLSASVGVVPMLVLGFFLVRAAWGASEWSRNNSLPIASAPALVLAKRAAVWGGAADRGVQTNYYVTFEVAGGDRRELSVAGPEYGSLVEGDFGTLTRQGTWFLGFRRDG